MDKENDKQNDKEQSRWVYLIGIEQRGGRKHGAAKVEFTVDESSDVGTGDKINLHVLPACWGVQSGYVQGLHMGIFFFSILPALVLLFSILPFSCVRGLQNNSSSF